MDEQNPSIKVIIHGQEIEGAIVDGGSGVNVINKTTCDRLGITKWEACPFWLRMADTNTVQPIGLLRCRVGWSHFSNISSGASFGSS